MRPLPAATADPDTKSARLGKARAPLPQEYILAELVKDVENPHPSWNTTVHACKWKGVTCTEGGDVSQIGFQYVALDFTFLRGKICWKLPSTLLYFRSLTLELWGESPTEHLPQGFLSMSLYQNKFTGAINLCDLPTTLENLSLHQNKFEGPIDLSHLPATLKTLSVGVNSLTGELNFTQLPSSLKDMDFMMNQFHGVVDLDHLPRNLFSLELSRNPNLRGFYRASRMPEKMRTEEKSFFFSTVYKIQFRSARTGARFNIEGTGIVEYK